MTRQNQRLASLFEGDIEPELENVCSTFTELQKQRNQADYDAGRRPYQRAEVMGYVSRAASAHSDWEKVCNGHNALVFLLAGAKLFPNRD
ncbi:MAG: hypothetical protein GY822_11180 [Deltaproteobacteria bacterium]|nr:hypothetical protein [Deltaproteobacteria bacterium]